MLGLGFVRSLEEDWRETLDRVARRRGWPTSRDTAKLGEAVSRLSAAYNDPARAHAAMVDAGAARLGFSFPRDVPKGAAAVRELVACRRLTLPPTRPLRVLDLGAGLGASTWGVVRALAAAGMGGVVEALWVDSDASALELGSEIARQRKGEANVELQVQTRQAKLGGGGWREPSEGFDLVIASQVLSEMDVALAPTERLARHVSVVSSWLGLTKQTGALVLVEPALRDRTRHLHGVRDALSARPAISVFAPCLHRGACPAMVREDDWCHEDLPVDLPPWLVPVARAAGLRFQGLTFGYLVLRRDGVSLREELVDLPGAMAVRVVSGSLATKGKREAFVCGELPPIETARGLAKLMRLNRDASEANAAWEQSKRGDLLLLTPAHALERPRMSPHTVVRFAELRAKER